jgi:dihydrofolate synthase/folylpolyglutamate synthase
VFGPDRVVAVPRLDDAIEAATALADEAAGPGLGSAGILITGSTTTAGEARTLLGAPGISALANQAQDWAEGRQ